MPEEQPGSIASRPSGHRVGFPIAFGVLALVGLAVVRLQPELERNARNWVTAAIVLLALVLTVIWFLLLSRFSWRARLITFAVLAGSIFGLRHSLRVDGTMDGTGLPRLVWKWTPPHRWEPSQPVVVAPVQEASALGADLPEVPQFFGPNRNGIVPGARLLRDWNSTPPKELWRQAIGSGWSAFAVVEGRAYTQEQRGEEEVVTCYDVVTGRLLWTHADNARFFQWQGGEGPRATPTVHAGHVFTMGATGILNCLDAKTGTRVWMREVLVENKLENLTWGVSCSPLVFDGTVVVTGGQGSGGPTVLAYRRSDGEPLWRSGTDNASYSSPIIATLAGQRLVLSANAASLTAHQPETGELLLSHPWAAGEKWPKAAQPVVIEGDRVFLSAGYGLGCVLLEVKAGTDGKLAANPLWKNLNLKTQFNSAAARDGFLYGLDDGMLACVEISTGARKWKEGRYGSGQTLLADELVIIQSERGPVVLVEAKSDGARELGRIPALKSKTWNYPTLVGHYLLVRNDQEVACYELPIEKGDP